MVWCWKRSDQQKATIMLKGFSITQVLGASGVTLSPSNVWNDAGTTFTGIRFNVTDTASNAASLLMDLQVGGVSQFSVRKDGLVNFGGGTNVDQNGTVFLGTTTSMAQGGGNFSLGTYNNAVHLRSTWAFSWSPTDSNSPTQDLALFRDAANTLAQRNGVNAQTLRVYGTYTDASNYRRVAIGMTTAGVASIAPQGAGTGASGNELHISGLPTANPGAGILWNDGGTVKVGT